MVKVKDKLAINITNAANVMVIIGKITMME